MYEKRPALVKRAVPASVRLSQPESGQLAPELIYKIATTAVADKAGDALPRMPIDERDGFIHLSTAEQLAETLRLHFAGQNGLVLIAVRTAALGDSLRWEPSRGGALFPHIYGDIAGPAVAWRRPISVADDGSTTLPAEVR